MIDGRNRTDCATVCALASDGRGLSTVIPVDRAEENFGFRWIAEQMKGVPYTWIARLGEWSFNGDSIQRLIAEFDAPKQEATK